MGDDLLFLILLLLFFLLFPQLLHLLLLPFMMEQVVTSRFEELSASSNTHVRRQYTREIEKEREMRWKEEEAKYWEKEKERGY